MPENKVPWIICLIVFTVFFFTTPYRWFSSVDMLWKPTIVERIEYGSTSNIGRQVSLVMLGLFAALTCLRDRTGRFRFTGMLSVLVTLFMSLVSLSVLWSDDKVMTVKKLMVFYLLSFAASALAKRFSFRQITQFVIVVSGLTLFISIAAEVTLGTFRPLDADYRFSGVIHPNAQGANCALLLLSLTAYLTTYRTSYRLLSLYKGIVYLIPALFLLLTKSRSALITCLFAIVLFIFFPQPPRRKFLMLYTGFAVLPLVLLILYTIGAGDIVSGDAFLLGRDTDVGTLTGRTPLWEDLNDYARQRSLLGYGYDSFWTTARTTYLMSKHGSWVASEHSSYFNIILGLGFVGFTMFVAMLAAALGRSVLLYVKSKNVEYGYFFAVLSSICVNMFSETILFQPELMSFIVIMIIVKLAFYEHSHGSYLPNSS